MHWFIWWLGTETYDAYIRHQPLVNAMCWSRVVNVRFARKVLVCRTTGSWINDGYFCDHAHFRMLYATKLYLDAVELGIFGLASSANEKIKCSLSAIMAYGLTRIINVFLMLSPIALHQIAECSSLASRIFLKEFLCDDISNYRISCDKHCRKWYP